MHLCSRLFRHSRKKTLPKANRYHHYSTEDLLQLVNKELEEMDQEPVSRRTIELDFHYLEERISRVSSMRKKIDEFFMENGIEFQWVTPTEEEMQTYTISFSKL